MGDVLTLPVRKSPGPRERLTAALAAKPGISPQEARTLARVAVASLSPEAALDGDEALFAEIHTDPAEARSIVEDWIMAVLK